MERGYCVSLQALRPRQAAASSLDAEPRLEDVLADLSPREIEVAKLLATQLSIKQIAEILFISTNTVKTHERHILKKLSILDRRALSCLILDCGLELAGNKRP